MAYVQRAPFKYKSAALVVSIEEREEAKAIFFELVQRELFDEETNSLKAEEDFPKVSKILQFSIFLDEDGLIRSKDKNSIRLQCKASNAATLKKHHAVELFLRNEHKDNQHEGTEHIRNFIQQKMWILGIRNDLRQIKDKCVTCRKGRAQTIAPVMAELPEERLDASKPLQIFDLTTLARSQPRLDEETKSGGVVSSHV